MSSNEVSFKTKTDLESAIGHLEKVVACLKAGQVRIGSGEQAISIKTENVTKLQIEAGKKPGKQSLSIKLTWRADAVVENGEDLTISSDEGD